MEHLIRYDGDNQAGAENKGIERTRFGLKDPELARRIVAHRIAKGITQQALADFLQLSQSTISMIERGAPMGVRLHAQVRDYLDREEQVSGAEGAGIHE